MKVRNDAKLNSVDSGFIPFSGAPKCMWGCKEQLSSLFVTVWKVPKLV